MGLKAWQRLDRSVEDIITLLFLPVLVSYLRIDLVCLVVPYANSQTGKKYSSI
ncbi:hypothetical protein S7335_913 [Synechococcus sp. PCC 7335]|nr:hypothetical protein S7335_913 [Synechococcus sp. PCC 7335]